MQVGMMPGPDPLVAARLQTARKNAGFRSASAFARHLNISTVTYMHHESGYRTLTQRAAELYAEHLATSARELLFGAYADDETPDGIEVIVVGLIRKHGAVQERKDSRKTVALGGQLVSHEVIDDTLYPAYRKGDLVLHRPLNGRCNLTEIDGHECVVRLDTGETMLGQVIAEPGGTVSVLAYAAPPLRHARLVAAELIRGVIRHLPGDC